MAKWPVLWNSAKRTTAALVVLFINQDQLLSERRIRGHMTGSRLQVVSGERNLAEAAAATGVLGVGYALAHIGRAGGATALVAPIEAAPGAWELALGDAEDSKGIAVNVHEFAVADATAAACVADVELGASFTLGRLAGPLGARVRFVAAVAVIFTRITRQAAVLDAEEDISGDVNVLEAITALAAISVFVGHRVGQRVAHNVLCKNRLEHC